MFDHVEVAVSDLDASERYRTVLSVLGAEPVRGDSQLVEWEDWDLFATVREHPVSRGLHRNSVEALHGEPELRVSAGGIDHLWIRARDLDASRRFYATIAPHAGLRLGDDEPGRVQFRGDGHSFSLIDDERPPTEHVHIAFGTTETSRWSTTTGIEARRYPRFSCGC
jgi:catechol 2,3-dioxygenase-like lactoylglutathione lyase family enzyme